MSTGTKIAISILVVTLLSFGGCALTVYGKVKNVRQHEVVIKKAKQEAGNVHSNMVAKVREIAQVPGMYAEDLGKVVNEALQAKYGEEGSQAMFQWFKDMDLKIDTAMYTKLQRVIESSRNDFAAQQKMQLDKVQQLELFLADPFDEWVVGVFGYPRIDLDEYSDVVKTDTTREAFETGVDKPLELR